MSLHAIVSRCLYNTTNSITLPYDGLLDITFSHKRYLPIFAYDSPYNNFLSFSTNYQPDVIVYNHPTEQLKDVKSLQRLFHCNSLLILNDFPTNTSQLYASKQANFVLANGEHLAKAWSVDQVISPEIPKFQAVKKSNVCCITGNFHDEDLQIAHLIMNRINGQFINTKGGFKTFNTALAASIFCVCPTNDVSCESAILWAMAHGCIVITNTSRWANQWIYNGVNGFIVDKLQDSIKIISELDEVAITKISLSARTFVQNHFPVIQDNLLTRTIKEASETAWKL